MEVPFHHPHGGGKSYVIELLQDFFMNHPSKFESFPSLQFFSVNPSIMQIDNRILHSSLCNKGLLVFFESQPSEDKPSLSLQSKIACPFHYYGFESPIFILLPTVLFLLQVLDQWPKTSAVTYTIKISGHKGDKPFRSVNITDKLEDLLSCKLSVGTGEAAGECRRGFTAGFLNLQVENIQHQKKNNKQPISKLIQPTVQIGCQTGLFFNQRQKCYQARLQGFLLLQPETRNKPWSQTQVFPAKGNTSPVNKNTDQTAHKVRVNSHIQSFTELKQCAVKKKAILADKGEHNNFKGPTFNKDVLYSKDGLHDGSGKHNCITSRWAVTQHANHVIMRNLEACKSMK